MSDRGIFIDVCVPTAVKLKFSLTLFGLELIENVQLYPYYLLCSDGADLKKSAPSVSVIGLGYVGLCTAVTLASRGFRVIGVDNDETKLELIQGAKSPFHEPRLNNLVREGTAVDDTLHPDVVVIGANDARSARTVKAFISRFHGKNIPSIMVTRAETAELVKYASNAFLAARVSCINTIANIAQIIPDVDVTQVAEAISYIPRIGSLFLEAGPGYGGSCFHKDLQALISFSKDHGYDPLLLQATEDTNEQQSDRVVNLSEKLLGSLTGKRIAVLGLSFKKDTDDIREAASIRVIDHLSKKGATVVAYDPAAMPNARKLLGSSVEFAEDEHTAIRGADCCIVMTEWGEFKRLRPRDFLPEMKTPNLVDARRIYQPSEYARINYARIGLGSPER